jgi:hypothetical protein
MILGYPLLRNNAMLNIPAHTIAAQAQNTALGRNPNTALARAEANAARFSQRSTSRPIPPGERPLNAIAAIAFDADESRARAWNHLAVLRTAACVENETSNTECERQMLREELQILSALAVRRRQALRDGGAAEVVYRRHMHRSMLVSWKSNDLWLLAKSREDELFAEPGDAAGVLLAIEAALLHERSSAWGNIAQLHGAFAAGEKPDADTIADLRACRAEIARLSAMLPAANAASGAEYEAWLKEQNPENQASDRSDP